MRIAATRSSRVCGLEGLNPKFWMVFEGFDSRSTEVDRGRDSVWAISRRPEACRSSESHQIVDLFMLYPVEVVAGSGRRAQLQKNYGFVGRGRVKC